MENINLLKALTDNIKIDKSKCTFCGKCTERCVLDNMRMNLAPCRAACPLGLNVQGYVQLVARGRDDDARKMIAEVLPFSSIICRICERPCEEACHRKTVDGQAVGINNLKRYLFDKAVPAGLECAAKSGKSVAIVGAGPAGLMAAHELITAGHAVTVYDGEAKGGGVLRSILPGYKLHESVLDEQIKVLHKAGVEFRFNNVIKGEAALDDLLKKHGAVIAATGTGVPRRLNIPGEDANPGVMQSIDFLRQVRQGKNPKLAGRVVVIGGGYVAMDAAQIALRQGAEKVIIVYRRTSDKFKVNPDEMELARRLGIEFAFTWKPLEIVFEEGALKGVLFGHDMGMLPPACRDYPDFKPDEKRMFEAQHVLIAAGQEKSGLLSELPGQGDIHPLSLQAGEKPIFVAGDLWSGASSAIAAMASGRNAAESVKRLLVGADLYYERAYRGPCEYEFDIDVSAAKPGKRQEPERHTCTGSGDYTCIDGVYTAEQAVAEASRCLSCGGPTGYHRTCWFCLPCEVECPEKALWVEIPYLLR